jgi:hypothetical protein
MVKVYAIALVVGIIGLLAVILGGSFAANLGRDDLDPGKRVGRAGRAVIGGLVGLGMAGLSAEYSPLDLESTIVLLLAVIGAAAGATWAYYGGGVAET